VPSPDYLNVWLSTTTCGRSTVKRSILLENDAYIVLKHNSHSEYMGRHSGSATCIAYAALYLKSDIHADLYHFRQGATECIKKWEGGRIALSRIVDDCRDLGIDFTAMKK
jgi:hypothetical protein